MVFRLLNKKLKSFDTDLISASARRSVRRAPTTPPNQPVPPAQPKQSAPPAPPEQPVQAEPVEVADEATEAPPPEQPVPDEPRRARPRHPAEILMEDDDEDSDEDDETDEEESEEEQLFEEPLPIVQPGIIEPDIPSPDSGTEAPKSGEEPLTKRELLMQVENNRVLIILGLVFLAAFLGWTAYNRYLKSDVQAESDEVTYTGLSSKIPEPFFGLTDNPERTLGETDERNQTDAQDDRNPEFVDQNAENPDAINQNPQTGTAKEPNARPNTDQPGDNDGVTYTPIPQVTYTGPGSCFSLGNITVRIGSTVHFVNGSHKRLRIASNDYPELKSNGFINQYDSHPFTFIFNKPGTWSYYNEDRPNCKGTVKVQ